VFASLQEDIVLLFNSSEIFHSNQILKKLLHSPLITGEDRLLTSWELDAYCLISTNDAKMLSDKAQCPEIREYYGRWPGRDADPSPPSSAEV
jgi:hypothetical protein